MIVKNIEESNLEEFKQFIMGYTIEESNFTITIINEKQLLITFKLDEDVTKLIDILDKEIPFKETTIQCNTYIKPPREIIFIKYDALNMKYLYLCSVRSTSWKNQ